MKCHIDRCALHQTSQSLLCVWRRSRRRRHKLCSTNFKSVPGPHPSHPGQRLEERGNPTTPKSLSATHVPSILQETELGCRYGFMALGILSTEPATHANEPDRVYRHGARPTSLHSLRRRSSETIGTHGAVPPCQLTIYACDGRTADESNHGDTRGGHAGRGGAATRRSPCFWSVVIQVAHQRK